MSGASFFLGVKQKYYLPSAETSLNKSQVWILLKTDHFSLLQDFLLRNKSETKKLPYCSFGLMNSIFLRKKKPENFMNFIFFEDLIVILGKDS